MPRKPDSPTPKVSAQRVIGLYIDAGASPANIPAIAKRVKLTPSAVSRILKRKTSQQEISRRMEPIRQEVFRQQILAEAAQIAKEAQQKELSKAATSVQRQKIQLDVLEHELMMGVIGLDWQRYPESKLNIIKACYVVNGTMESGRDRMIIPKESGLGSDGPGTYQALFNRLALKSQPEQPNEQPEASGEVFDLIPSDKPPKPPQSDNLPPPGESIDEIAVDPKRNSRILSVEVE